MTAGDAEESQQCHNYLVAPGAVYPSYARAISNAYHFTRSSWVIFMDDSAPRRHNAHRNVRKIINKQKFDSA